MATGISWQTPPMQLVGRIKDYGERVWQAVRMLADFFAAKMEAYAKQHAPWTDRTTNARQGLRGFAVKTATRVVIWLVHSVFYGPYLEYGTRFMRPRPIIMPTLEAHYAEIMRAVRRMIGGS